MKKTFSKVISAVLSLALVISMLAIPASALEWDSVQANGYASHYSTYQYTYGKYYKNLTQIPLTGDGARDVIAVAASQMGYLEGDDSSGYTGEVGGYSNYTEYGYYMGLSGGASHAWCAAFCSWVFYAAEVTDTDGYYYDTNSGNIWADTYVPDWSNYLISQGRYRYAETFRSSYNYSQGLYIPQPGDLVFFATSYEDYPGYEGHIGLVAYSDGTYVYTLEGNTSSQDGVESEGGGAFFKKYSLYSDSLAGFGVMPYEKVEGLPEIDYTGANPTPGLYTNIVGSKGVYRGKEDTSPTWTLPANSIFEVSKIELSSDGYTMLYSKCEINGETVYGWITFGNDTNGNTKTLQIYATPIVLEELPLEGTPFFVTHYNHANVEGAGSIMTEAYTGGEWNLHVAFSPIAGGKYQITAISDGTADGSGTPLAIPTGGFVYNINKGNDWPTLCEQYPDLYAAYVGQPNYTSAACDAMLERMSTWSVGDEFEFTNIDIAGKVLPSSTPYKSEAKRS